MNAEKNRWNLEGGKLFNCPESEMKRNTFHRTKNVDKVLEKIELGDNLEKDDLIYFGVALTTERLGVIIERGERKKQCWKRKINKKWT